MIGLYQKSEKLLKKVLIGLKKTFGDNHLATFYAMQELAVTLCKQDRFSEAEVINKKCLDGYKAVLGEKHRQTLGCTLNLANTYNC